MPLLPAFFRPKGAYFGMAFGNTSVAIGTGGTSVADTNTTSYILPKPACTTCQLIGLQLDAQVAAVSAGQTVTAQVFKRDNAGTPADRTLTATKSLTTSVVSTAGKTYTIAITSTSAVNLTFQSSDLCRIDAVASGAVSTQPQVAIVGLWAIITP